MISYYLFFLGTLLLSFNFVEFLGLAVTDWLYIAAFFFMLLETLVIDRNNLSSWLRQPFIIPAWLILFGAIISTYHSRSAEAAFGEIIQQIYVMTIFVFEISNVPNPNKAPTYAVTEPLKKMPNNCTASITAQNAFQALFPSVGMIEIVNILVSVRKYPNLFGCSRVPA